MAPLMELEESLIYGLWPRRLRIFEDRIEPQEFVLLRETTESREYGWIERVTVSGGGPFANLPIRGRHGEYVLMRALDRETAERARALIEARVVMDRDHSPHSREQPRSPHVEDLVRKLADLRDAGILSQGEYEARRAAAVAMKQKHP